MPQQRKVRLDQRALHDFLLARAAVPFAWGSNDCCLFPADAILAGTGVDLADDFRGRYTTKAEAFALIKTVTGKDSAQAAAVANAAAWCAERHGLEACEPLFARSCDLVVFKNGDRLISGIVSMNFRHILSVGESGLKKFLIATPDTFIEGADPAMALVLRAWHV